MTHESFTSETGTRFTYCVHANTFRFTLEIHHYDDIVVDHPRGSLLHSARSLSTHTLGNLERVTLTIDAVHGRDAAVLVDETAI